MNPLLLTNKQLGELIKAAVEMRAAILADNMDEESGNRLIASVEAWDKVAYLIELAL